ncbi:hypothetical protein MRB53_027003 [Persea americana]|uniref:Uncharacterized protein n=1 Tax=Persea americana TaxID=3435 RepID=A0ACC2LJT6_PERAE|nr:hypothetical protein MRB53_027003 [Persea americana]
MASWRRYQRDNSQQESRWMNLGLKYKNPPSGWSRQPTVPSWDKRLSTSVSKIPWKKICELKRFECSFQNILEWNDSAVKEAAQNAKARFCAKISGLPCDTSLPDLDLYIEDVDWTAYVDPRLLSALNGEPTVSEHSDNDCNHEILDSTVCNQPFIPSGWGGIDDIAVMNANNTVATGLRILHVCSIWILGLMNACNGRHNSESLRTSSCGITNFAIQSTMDRTLATCVIAD